MRKTPALDMFDSPMNQISDEELQYDSGVRRKVFFLYKKSLYPDVIVIPLHNFLIEAKARTENGNPDIMRIPVALYKKNVFESYNRPLWQYDYIGDNLA